MLAQDHPHAGPKIGASLKRSPQHTAGCTLGYLHAELHKFSAAEWLRLRSLLPSNPSWIYYPISKNKFQSYPGTHLYRFPLCDMHSKWVLCMHQLKAAPTHPGCYINHSADISKSFHRRVAIKQTWGGGIHGNHTAFRVSCFCTGSLNPQHFCASLALRKNNQLTNTMAKSTHLEWFGAVSLAQINLQ